MVAFLPHLFNSFYNQFNTYNTKNCQAIFNSFFFSLFLLCLNADFFNYFFSFNMCCYFLHVSIKSFSFHFFSFRVFKPDFESILYRIISNEQNYYHSSS